MGIKDELQRRMDARGENPHSLAAKTKVTQATLWRILAGESVEPKESTVSKLARFFGVSNDEMWGRPTSQDSSHTAQESDPGITNDERILLALYRGLTKRQKGDIINNLEAQKQVNDSILDELTRRQA